MEGVVVQLPTFFISTLCGSERSVSSPNHLTSAEIIPGTYMKEAQWYGEQKNPHPLEIKPRFLVVQPVFQSLY
jgi:hypothetical protein